MREEDLADQIVIYLYSVKDCNTKPGTPETIEFGLLNTRDP